ncbi:MAG TPA: ankyrin repeat domain-containing protein [Thermoanaerobaculia bacterium]|jgi:ankyrin repeat protein
MRDSDVQAFFRAAGTGQIDEVRRFLDEQPDVVNAVGPHPFWGGRPQALHVAIESDRAGIFELLLERGADVNGSNDAYDRWSPFMLAIQRGRSAMRDELLRRGAPVGLFEALLLGDDAFLSNVDALPAETPNNASPLAFARTPRAIERLIALGASTTAKDRWGTTPIQALSALGPAGAPLVRLLIAHGVEASPIEYARLGDLDAIAADPSNAHDDAILMAAVDRGHHALASWLLEHGANPNARTKGQSRQTALHSAAWNGDLRMAQILVAAGADPKLVDEEHHTTPQHWAEVSFDIRQQEGCREVAKFLGDTTS